MMQFHKRLDQSQADAGTAGSSLSLEEALEDFISLLLLNTLAGISHIQSEFLTFIFQGNKDVATSRSIFQGIAQKIKDYSAYLLLIGYHFMAALESRYIQMEFDLLAFGSKLEIPHPYRQGFHDVEAIELQVHLSILDFSEIEDAAHQLLQGDGITLHHLEQFPALALDAAIFQEHLHRIGYQG